MRLLKLTWHLPCPLSRCLARMTHVDKNNTDHYDYSGLLYLSEHGRDFDGGLLTFYDPDDEVTPVLELAPRPGRIALFSSDVENPHAVNMVTSGRRLTLSFWFTCSKENEFQNFLDGKVRLWGGGGRGDTGADITTPPQQVHRKFGDDEEDVAT